MAGLLGCAARVEELGDVVVHGHHSGARAANDDRDREHLHVHERAVFAASLPNAGRPAAGEHLLGVGFGLGPGLLGRDELVEVAADHLLRAVPEQLLERRVAGGDVHVEVQVHDRDRIVQHYVFDVPLGGGEQAGVLDRDRGLGSEQLEQPEILGTELPVGIRVHRGDRTHQPAADHERRHHDGLHCGLGVLGRATAPFLVAGDDQWFVGLRHLTHRPLPQSHAVSDGVPAHVVARGYHEVLRGLVVRGHLRSRDIEQRGRALEHPLQHFRELQLTREVLHRVEQGSLFPGAAPLRGEQAGILDRDGRLCRKQVQQSEIGLAELARGVRVDARNGAHQPGADEQRYDHDRLHGVVRVLRGAPLPHLVVGDDQ